MRARLALLTFLLAACGQDREAISRMEVTPTPPAPAAPSDEPTVAFTCDAIGWTDAPALPTEVAEDANRAGLRAHGQGRFEEAERRFAEAIAATPSFAMAHFNHACALARIGRGDEALRELAPLVCADLPTFGSRLDEDPDLAGLRDRDDVRRAVDRVRARHENAMREGVSLVAFRDGPEGRLGPIWTTTQAGVYLHAEHRFVPMSPAVREPGGEERALVAARLFPALGRALVVSGRGNDAEDPAPLAHARVRVYDAPSGRLLVDRPLRGERYAVLASLAPDGTPVEADMRRDAETGATRARNSVPFPLVRLDLLSWSLVTAPSPRRIVSGKLVGEGSELRLGPGHAAMGGHQVLERDGVAIAISARHGDCGVEDRYVVDRVELATGQVTRLDEGEGQPHATIGEDGALYLQVHLRVRRFGRGGAEPPQELPAGIVLTSAPDDFNPYC